MLIDAKLQLKQGQTIAVINGPIKLAIKAEKSSVPAADSILAFVKNKKELVQNLKIISAVGRQGRVVWIAYPKAKQLATDLNRDILHELMSKHHLDAVRQIALDETWSAMRFKYLK